MHGFSQAHVNSCRDNNVVSPQLNAKSRDIDRDKELERLRQSKNKELEEEREAKKREDKIAEEWEEAINEAQLAKIKRIPLLPTQKETEEHCTTHVPFRNWCEFCVHGKAKDDPHY